MRNTHQILVVEDEPLALTVMKKYLNDLNHTPDIAGNGKEAIALASQQSYKIIFMDIGLPDITGIKAAHAIREFDQQVPIIVVTAYPPKDIIPQCQQLGIEHILQKPITKQELQQFLAQYLNQ